MAKSKFREVYCNSCKKETKMLTLKEPENNKGWFQCTKCKHSFYIDLSLLEVEKKEEKQLPQKEECITYSPEKEYSIGDPIYHVEWDDIGKVEAKETISDGGKAIVVKFQNAGVKKLIEKLSLDKEDIDLAESFDLHNDNPIGDSGDTDKFSFNELEGNMDSN